MSRRRLLLLAGLIALLTLALPAAPAQAIDPCDLAGPPGIPSPTKAGCEAAKGVIEKGPGVVKDPGGAVKDVITAPVKAAGDEVMKGITNWVGNGASWLIGQAGKLIDETTTPRIESPWFLRQYATMGALAAVFALPLLLLAVMQALIRQDVGQLARSAFLHLPLAFALTAAAVTIVQLLLQLTDAMSAQVASSVGSDAKEFFKDTGKSLGSVLTATGGNPVPLFAVFLAALVAAAGAFCVWLELLVRSAAIYVAVLFLPFTFVAMIWPQTARWCRRLIEVLGAVIAAKFVIVAIMALAAAGLGQSRGEDAFQGVLAGAALMMLAAFSPFVLLKLLPFAESAIASAGGTRGALARSMPGAAVMSPAMVMRMAMDRNNGGGGGGLRAAPAGACPVAAGAAGASAAGAVGAAARSRGEGTGRYGATGSGPEAPGGLRYTGSGASGSGRTAAKPESPSASPGESSGSYGGGNRPAAGGTSPSSGPPRQVPPAGPDPQPPRPPRED